MDPTPILTTTGRVAFALYLVVFIISRIFIVRRAGLSGWWAILWCIPIVGWFFKVWFAFADWPNVKGPSKPKATATRSAPAKRTKSKSRRASA